MPADYVTSQQTQTPGTTGTDVLGNMPAGAVVGELLFAHVITKLASGGTVGTITPPAGWTLVPNTDVLSQANQRGALYWKPVQANEPASYTWTSSVPVSSSVVIARISGADTTNPVNGSAAQGTAATTSPTIAVLTAPSVTPNQNNTTNFLFWWSGATAVVTAESPAGPTRRYNLADPTAPSRALSMSTIAGPASGVASQAYTVQNGQSTGIGATVLVNQSGDVVPPGAPSGPALELITYSD